MRRKLLCGFVCLVFAVLIGLPTSAYAYHIDYQYYHHQTYHSLDRVFHRMDANHDGIVTEREFVAAHSNLTTVQAVARYQKLAVRGGITRRYGVTGMTLHQFKVAHKAW